MTEQADQWVQAWKSDLIRVPTKSSLAAFFIGINDTGDVNGWTNITDWSAFWKAEMNSYFRVVDQVYDTGLRHFLFLNVPDRPTSGSNPQIATFNSLLAQHVAFKASNKDVSAILFDTNKLFADILDNAAAYGFTNTTGFFGDRLNLNVTGAQVQSGDIISNGTSSGGANWIQMITGCYQGRPSECPRTLWDFAFGGATIDPDIVALEAEWIIPLTDQGGQWVQARNDNLLEAPGDNSLAAFFIGINDMLGATPWKNVTEWDTFWNGALDSYFEVVASTADFDRAPGLVGNPNVANHAAQVRTFNSLLEKRIEEFKASKHSPSQFGFANTTGFCGCSDPEYFWRDPYHPTEKFHRLIADGVLSELEKMMDDLVDRRALTGPIGLKSSPAAIGVARLSARAPCGILRSREQPSTQPCSERKLIEAPGNDSLAAFFIGINDTSDVKGWTNITDWMAFWNREMDSYFRTVEQVYDTGIRSFLFLNVPTRDRSPGSLGRPDVGNQIAQVKNFNILLEQRVNAFKSSRNDTSVVLFDTNMLMDEALDNARQFGFTNTTGFCRCSDPGYFWYAPCISEDTEHMDRARSPPPPPGSAALRADMVAKLKRAASLPRMKDGRRPPMPMHSEGVSEGERVIPHSDDPDVERRRAAHAVGHEPDTETEGESGAVSEPTPNVGVYGRTDSLRTIRPGDTPKETPSTGLQRSATTGGKIETQKSTIPMPKSPGSEDGEDWTEDDPAVVANSRPPPLVIPTTNEQSVPQLHPAPPPRKRTRSRSRSRSRSLERKRIAQQLKQLEEEAQMSSSTDDHPPLPDLGPDALGPYYSPLVYSTPMSSMTPHPLPGSRAQSPALELALSAAMLNAARTPPLAALQQQIQARSASRSPTPNLLGSPIFQTPISPTTPMMLNPGVPSLDHIRDRLGAHLFRSKSAKERMEQQGEEYQIPLPPSRVNTPSALSRANTPGLGRSNTTAGTPIGDRNVVRQVMMKKLVGRVDKERGDGDQTSGAEDTVLMHGRATPFGGKPITPGTANGVRPNTPGNIARANTPGVRSPTPGGRGGAQTPDGGTSSNPGTPTQGKRGKRSHRRRSRNGVVPVVDDREDSQAVAPQRATSTTYSPNTHVLPVQKDDDDDDDERVTELQRQRSLREREKALQKLAGGPLSRAPSAHRPPLVEEEDDETPEANVPTHPTLPTPASTTPQPRFPHHISDTSVHSGTSIPVFMSDQGTLSSFRTDAFPVTISQYHKEGNSPATRVLEEVEDQEYEGEQEQVVYPESPRAKARRTLIEAFEKNGMGKSDSSLGNGVPDYAKHVELDEDEDNDGETDREVQPPFPAYHPPKPSHASWISRPSTVDMSSPQVELSALLPSTPPTTTLFPNSPQLDPHGSSASLSSNLGFPAGASSTTSGHSSSQNQQTTSASQNPSFTDWEDVPDSDLPAPQSSKRGKKDGSVGRGWSQKVMTSFGSLSRSASRAEGRRSRSNSIVTGKREDSVNRESAASATSGKTDGTHSQGSHHTAGQNSHPGASVMSLTNHMHGGVSPLPPVLSTDPRLADNKLHAFPGIHKLEAERERKLRERGQSVSNNLDNVEQFSNSATPSPEREPLTFALPKYRRCPPKQEYLDIRASDATPAKGLPHTRDGVKKWLKVFQPTSGGNNKPARNRKASLTDVITGRMRLSENGSTRGSNAKQRPPLEHQTGRSLSPSEVTPSPASTHSLSFSTTLSPAGSPRNSKPTKPLLKLDYVMAQVEALLSSDSQSRPVQLDDPPRKLLLMSPVLQVVNQNTVKDRYLFLFTDLLVIAKPLILEDDSARDAHKPSLERTLVIRSVIELHKLHLHSIRDEHTPLVSSSDAEPQPAMKLFAQKFAKDGIHAVASLQEKAKLQNEPATVAQLLFQTTELDRVQLGLVLAHRSSKAILRHFIDRFGFATIRIDHALRIFLLSIVLPSDSGSVDYLLATFATRWFEANSGVVAFDKDLAIRLVLAIMQLNSALHSGYDAQFSFPNRAISVRDFIDAFRTRDVRMLVPDEVLERIYASVRHQRIDQALDPREDAPVKNVIISPGRLPDRLTCRVASEPITIRIPEPDSDFTIRLYGQDLTFEPSVLDFSDSNEQTFKVVGNSFGTKSMIMARTGPNAALYTGLPLSNKFSVERAFMRNTFQVSFVRHTEQPRKYMFSVEGSLVHQQWMSVMRRQIARAVEADAAVAPVGALSTQARRAAEAVAVQVLRDTLIAPEEGRNTTTNSHRPGHTRVGSSMLAFGEGLASSTQSSSTPKGAPRTGHDLVTICQQNSLLPLVLGFLHSRMDKNKEDQSEDELSKSWSGSGGINGLSSGLNGLGRI
ncbi:Sec7 guanine nucleotide exchange factor [Rhizoctonia solani]|uniref:Sec7 guanine nucleotide exchange factor n=1 Tax=Rhizoctonia solani TaxID=456999 RepID=A0A8H8SYH9_9AGAM|nr:Sec7 guanine nucleotide exchange factor [Rhizoctonia solani]QRW21582.1 Sec7 guanine nucleotide exchange factor [Rhizoctonia solani]